MEEAQEALMAQNGQRRIYSHRYDLEESETVKSIIGALGKVCVQWSPEYQLTSFKNTTLPTWKPDSTLLLLFPHHPCL